MCGSDDIKSEKELHKQTDLVNAGASYHDPQRRCDVQISGGVLL